MKQPSKDLIAMWNHLRNSNYWSMVLNYEYNTVKDKAIELGLLHECKDKIIDRTEYDFCPMCGKKIGV